jgi:hypothetical protein
MNNKGMLNMKIRLSPKRKVVLIDINATQDLIKIWNRR